MSPVLIYNTRLLDESIDGQGAVFCVEGKIHSVFQGSFQTKKIAENLVKAILLEDTNLANCSIEDVEFFDAQGLTLTPAFVDMHVHFRDPGLTEKEDLNSGLRAACAGGYGTVVAMPNTKPVISSAQDARSVVQRAKEIGICNFYQSVSITKDFSGKDISHIDSLNPEEVPLITEDGHDVESAMIMLGAMTKAFEKGIIVSCHCEDPAIAQGAKPHRIAALELMKKYGLPAWGGDSSVGSVPQEALEIIEKELSCANDLLAVAENIATERNIALAKQANCHIHICHISTKEAVEAVRRARKSISNRACVTCEVTPHHLALCGTGEPYIRALVNPPLRSEEDRLSLMDAIRDGTIDCIATDHAPHTLDDKANGAPGFSGIETAYCVCNTVLVKDEQISEKKLSRLMSANPARILHLNKGVLKVGFDADFTLVAPNEKRVIEPASFFSKGKATPFAGKTFYGAVKAVFIAGKKKAL